MKLSVRYWYIIAALVIISVGIATAVTFSAPVPEAKYSTVSRIVVNSQMNSVRGIATSESREFNGLRNGYSSSVTADGATLTVSITVSGPDSDKCVQYANELAHGVEPQAKEFFSEGELPMELRIEETKGATKLQRDLDYSIIWVVALIALAAGVVVTTVIGKMRRPVIEVEGVQDAVKLPVLEALPATDGKRLLANVRFASKNDDVSTVFVIPVKSDRATGTVCDLLNDHLDVTQCKPLTSDLDKLYDARKADAVLVSVEKWKDTIPALKSTVAELRIAGVNLVGLVFVRRNKRS